MVKNQTGNPPQVSPCVRPLPLALLLLASTLVNSISSLKSAIRGAPPLLFRPELVDILRPVTSDALLSAHSHSFTLSDNDNCSSGFSVVEDPYPKAFMVSCTTGEVDPSSFAVLASGGVVMTGTYDAQGSRLFVASLTPSGDLDWFVYVPDLVTTGKAVLVLGDGTIIVVGSQSKGGYIVALDSSTAAVLWTNMLAAPHFGLHLSSLMNDTVLVMTGRLYDDPGEPFLALFNSTDGALLGPLLLFQYSFCCQESTPGPHDDTIAVIGYNGRNAQVSVFDLDLNEVWSVIISLPADLSPKSAITRVSISTSNANGTFIAIVGFDYDGFYSISFNSTTGEVVWSTNVMWLLDPCNGPWASTVGPDGWVYIGGRCYPADSAFSPVHVHTSSPIIVLDSHGNLVPSSTFIIDVSYFCNVNVESLFVGEDGLLTMGANAAGTLSGFVVLRTPVSNPSDALSSRVPSSVGIRVMAPSVQYSVTYGVSVCEFADRLTCVFDCLSAPASARTCCVCFRYLLCLFPLS